MVTLRRVSPDDAEWMADRWTGAHPLPGYALPDEADGMERLINLWNQGMYQGRRFEMLMIEADGQPAGLLSLYGQGENVSLGVCVHPSMQRKGAASGAVAWAVEYAREQGWKRITSECREDNLASMALHKKCGLTETGRKVNRKGNKVVCWEYILQQESGASGPA